VSRFIRSAFFPILVVIILAVVLQMVFSHGGSQGQQYTYTGFLNDLKAGKVTQVDVNVNNQQMKVILTSGQTETTGYVDATSLTTTLQSYPSVEVIPSKPGTSWWSSALISILPFILIIGVWIFLMNQMRAAAAR
jgi:cell division protease FtsH